MTGVAKKLNLVGGTTDDRAANHCRFGSAPRETKSRKAALLIVEQRRKITRGGSDSNGT
jgi:hypothetical protein